MVGSKYRLLPTLFKKFEPVINSHVNFFDVFGGSLIVGVNVKNYFQCSTTINDFDNWVPLKNEALIKNQTSHSGRGYTTQSAIKQFAKKVKHGYWDRVKIFSKILSTCKIKHKNYLDLSIPKNSVLYIDPPYFGKTKYYKNKLNFNEFYQWLSNLHYQKCKLIISFNNDTWFQKLGYWKIETINVTYSSKKFANKKSTEFLITNF